MKINKKDIEENPVLIEFIGYKSDYGFYRYVTYGMAYDNDKLNELIQEALDAKAEVKQISDDKVRITWNYDDIPVPDEDPDEKDK